MTASFAAPDPVESGDHEIGAATRQRPAPRHQEQESMMQSKPTDTDYRAKGAWLMQSEDDGGESYTRLYRDPVDAQRAARDINRTGIARHPSHYERLRRLGR